MTDDDDLVQCEGCSARCDHEVATPTDDGCYHCPACQSAWKAEVDACDHEWRAHFNSMGDPSQFCGRCSCVVPDRLFGKLFPGQPFSTEPYDSMSWLRDVAASPLGDSI